MQLGWQCFWPTDEQPSEVVEFAADQGRILTPFAAAEIAQDLLSKTASGLAMDKLILPELGHRVKELTK